MLFINNKYSKTYFRIIESAKTREELADVYTEIHHIIPKCLGGTNDALNLIKLTGRQHFICHWLLTKMVDEKSKKKMGFALNQMLMYAPTQARYTITGRKYELLKMQFSKINPFNNKEWQSQNRINHHLGKKRSEKTKQNLRDAWAKNRESRIGVNHSRYGKVVTEETRQKKSIAMKGKFIGEKNPMYGKCHTAETKEFLSKRLTNSPMPKKYLQCKYCNLTLDAGNHAKWHGEKCKLKN